MRQDSYDPTSSKDILTFHHSEGMFKTPFAIIPDQKSGQKATKLTELSQNSNGRISVTKIHKKIRPATGRPALVNLNIHNNIEKAFLKQDQEREIIRTLSTAQINKLSAGALQQQGKISAAHLTRLPQPTTVENNKQT